MKVVAPAVVTIRTGRKGCAPTDFQTPDFQAPDDLFRRFFGDQFGGGGSQRRPAPAAAAAASVRQHAVGSGVVVSTDGYILTNNHVIDGADDIKVDFTDGRTLTAKLVGTDKASDLAL